MRAGGKSEEEATSLLAIPFLWHGMAAGKTATYAVPNLLKVRTLAGKAYLMPEMRVCAKCSRNRQVKFYTGQRGTVCVTCQKTNRRSHGRKAHLAKVYDLTPEDYETLLAHQNGVCAICQGYRKVFDVDHDHKTNRIRGLTCRNCNGPLLARGARDNPLTLIRAAIYLLEPPCDQALGARFASGGSTGNHPGDVRNRDRIRAWLDEGKVLLSS